MNVSVVIPLRAGDPLNPPVIGPSDQLLIVEGLGSGEGRVRGAMDAVNDWIICCDGDASYPEDYVSRVKDIISSGMYPIGFRATRVGGFGGSESKEAGLVVRRDVFLERTMGFVANGRWDIGGYFPDLPVVAELVYYHPLTFSEGTAVAAGGAVAGGLGLAALLALL